MARLGPPIFLGVFTIIALALLTSGTSDEDDLRETFKLDAVYEEGNVIVSYQDLTENTNTVILEILGMDESFQKTFSDSEFTETIPFPSIPKYGWKVHPIVLEIDHKELGTIQLKTEIHLAGEPAPPVIYATL